MMTALLWILLAVCVLMLVIISSPIRFGMNASFVRRPRRVFGKIWVSFIHPALFRYSYSTRGHKEETVIFGLTRRKAAEAHKENLSEGLGGIHRTDVYDLGGDVGGTAADVRETAFTVDDNVGGIEADVPGADVSSEENVVYDDADLLWARLARVGKKILHDPFMTKALSDLYDGFKELRGSGGYRYISDKALRKKMIRWLWRVCRAAFTFARLDECAVKAKIGSRDPARVGKWYGYFTAVSGAIRQRNSAVRITMEPVFTERHFEFTAAAAGRTTIAMAGSSFLSAALAFPYLRLRKIRRELRKSAAGAAA